MDPHGTLTLQKILPILKRSRRFTYDIRGPHLTKGLVVILELRDPGGSVRRLARTIRTALEKRGYEGRVHVPEIHHVTLARILDADQRRLKALNDRFSRMRHKAGPGRIRVDRVCITRNRTKRPFERVGVDLKP